MVAKKTNLIYVQSVGAMRGLGRFYARMIAAAAKTKKSKHAFLLALVGPLGAGKTTFVQGFAAGLGIRHRVTSLTFVVMKIYPIPRGTLARLIHIDAYRITARDITQLGLSALIKDPKNLIIIEWADRIAKSLPGDTTWLTFYHGADTHKRMIDIRKTAV